MSGKARMTQEKAMSHAHVDVTYQLDVRTPMRDGIELSADIYLPRTDRQVPTVLLRTAFDRAGERDKGRFFAIACGQVDQQSTSGMKPASFQPICLDRIG